MTAGKDAPTPGEGKNSWLTGTVAWSFVALSQYILGIHPDFNGLIIDPCIPPDWKEFRVVRHWRDATYDIVVKNPDGKQKGVRHMTINGSPVRDIVPRQPAGSVNRIEVIL